MDSTKLNMSTFDVDFGVVTDLGNHPTEYYQGEYTITPTTKDQILDVRKFTMKENLTVKAIPKNYGEISTGGEYGNGLFIK